MNDIIQRLESLKRMAVHSERQMRGLIQAQRRQPPDPATLVAAAMSAEAKAAANRIDFESYVRGRYSEAAAETLLAVKSGPLGAIRAATAPAQTGNAGWAAELIDPTIAPVAILAPSSAVAQLVARASVLKLDVSTGPIVLPAISAGDLAGGWIGESEAIPVQRAMINGPIVAPAKVGVISTHTREIAKSTNFVGVLQQAMNADLSTTIDATFLGSAAATAAQPAGILAGIAPLAPSTATGTEAVASDLSALAAVPASSDLVFVARAEIRIRAQLLCAGALSLNWVDSASAGAAQVIALDAGSLAVGIGDMAFDVREQYLAVTVDSQPVPPVADAQTVGGWQMGLVGSRAVIDCSWALRSAGRAAHIDAIGW